MDYSSLNPSVWSAVITICILGTAIIFCNVLRLKVKFIERSLLPTAVLAGFILLVLRETGILDLNIEILSIICYHSVAIGFIAMALRVPKADQRPGSLLGIRTGALAVATYMLQIILGMGVAFILAATIMPDFFTSSGILLAYGFGQGPGQANNIGATFEMLGFTGGQSFGLALAAAGYLAAFVGGLIFLHVERRKRNLSASHESGADVPQEMEVFLDEAEGPASHSIDRLSVQIGLVLFVYLLGFFFTKGAIQLICLVAGEGVSVSLSSICWGFNFLSGVLMAMVVRTIIKQFRAYGIMRRQYQNNYLLTRISGCAFDFMIASGITVIELEKLQGLWLPFILMAVLGTLATFVFLKFAVKKIYPAYPAEAFVVMFGTWTGTISSGMILLREIDHDFSTPAANTIIVGSAYAIIFGLMLLIITSGAPSNPLLWFGVCIVYFFVLCFIAFFRSSKTAGKKRQRGKKA